MNLQEELQNFLNNSLAKRPQELTDIMKASAQKLIDDQVGKNAIQVGDKFPDTTLTNALGEPVKIHDLLGQGPLIINFYRGSWCPYCNLELRAYKEILPEIKAAGGNLIAISPELPDTSMSLVEKHGLEFDVLSDLNNQLAKELGLVFKLDDALVALYLKFGHDLAKAQGNDDFELPLPATFLVDRDGKVVLAHMDTDYTKRLEPSEALQALSNLQ